LDHDRGEVRLAAAAALRELAVAETYPALFERAKILTKRYKTKEFSSAVGEAYTEELVQLLTALGAGGFSEADALFRRYIPKGSGLPSTARAAAIWSLGLLHAGEAGEANLVGKLRSRLSDAMSLRPEAAVVRRFSAISLGRLKAESGLGTLREFHEFDLGSEIGAACRWAIEQITGEPAKQLTQPPHRRDNWFLKPLEPGN
jgi:hypothetical protein